MSFRKTRKLGAQTDLRQLCNVKLAHENTFLVYFNLVLICLDLAHKYVSLLVLLYDHNGHFSGKRLIQFFFSGQNLIELLTYARFELLLTSLD